MLGFELWLLSGERNIMLRYVFMAIAGVVLVGVVVFAVLSRSGFDEFKNKSIEVQLQSALVQAYAAVKTHHAMHGEFPRTGDQIEDFPVPENITLIYIGDGKSFRVMASHENQKLMIDQDKILSRPDEQ